MTSRLTAITESLDLGLQTRIQVFELEILTPTTVHLSEITSKVTGHAKPSKSLQLVERNVREYQILGQTP